MHDLTATLDIQLQRLDAVLLRLTTLRLLMAAGKHRMVPTTIDELEAAFAAFEEADLASRESLAATGHSSFGEAVAAASPTEAAALDQRLAQLKALHRDVRVALASTGSAAESAIRQAAATLPDSNIDLTRGGAAHPFLTEGR